MWGCDYVQSTYLWWPIDHRLCDSVPLTVSICLSLHITQTEWHIHSDWRTGDDTASSVGNVEETLQGVQSTDINTEIFHVSLVNHFLWCSLLKIQPHLMCHNNGKIRNKISSGTQTCFRKCKNRLWTSSGQTVLNCAKLCWQLLVSTIPCWSCNTWDFTELFNT